MTRVLVALVALAALAGNLRILRGDYATLQEYGTTLALILFGSALAPQLRTAARWRRELAHLAELARK